MLGVISLFGYLNRWNDSMGTSIEEGAVESGSQYLGKHGWNKGKHGWLDFRPLTETSSAKVAFR